MVVPLQVNTGSVNETDPQQGIAHMMEHMAFQGSEKYPSEDILKKLYNAMGMSFGGDANAFTMYRQTVFTFDCKVGRSDVRSITGEEPAKAKQAGAGVYPPTPRPPPPARSTQVT